MLVYPISFPLFLSPVMNTTVKKQWMQSDSLTSPHSLHRFESQSPKPYVLGESEGFVEALIHQPKEGPSRNIHASNADPPFESARTIPSSLNWIKWTSLLSNGSVEISRVMVRKTLID